MSKSVFRRWPNYEEVHHHFLGEEVRIGLSKLLRSLPAQEADELWDLITICIREGYSLVQSHGGRIFRLSQLFCNSADLYHKKLDEKNNRIYARQVILPLARANRQEILQHPEDFDQIIRRSKRKEYLDRQTKQLPEGEQVITAYGERLWPVLDPTYDYDQLRCACWYFRNIQQMISNFHDDSSIATIAINIRLSVKWFSEYSTHRTTTHKIAKICQIIRHISLLWEADPTKECVWPPYPHREGQW